jgi:hypothetical protein
LRGDFENGIGVDQIDAAGEMPEDEVTDGSPDPPVT